MTTEQEVERLVHENAGLVRVMVGRTLRLFPRLPGGYDRDDLHSLGSIGLLRAAQTFDAGRGVAFSTYACRCIENSIARALKRESDRQIDCISLSTLIGDDEDSPLGDQIADQSADAAATALNRSDREMLEQVMKGLPERQTHVIRAIYFDGRSAHELAERWGISPQTVQDLHGRALRALRLHLRRLGIRQPES